MSVLEVELTATFVCCFFCVVSMSLPDTRSLPVGFVASSSPRGSPSSSSPVSSFSRTGASSSQSSLLGLFRRRGEQQKQQKDWRLLPSSEGTASPCYPTAFSSPSFSAPSSSCQCGVLSNPKPPLQLPQSTFTSSASHHAASASPSFHSPDSVSSLAERDHSGGVLPGSSSSGRGFGEPHHHVCREGAEEVQSSQQSLQVERKGSLSGHVNSLPGNQWSSTSAGVHTPGCYCDCLSLPDCMPVCLHHKKPSSLASFFFFDPYLLGKVFTPHYTSLPDPFYSPSPSKALDSSLCSFLPGFPLLFAVSTASLLLCLYYFVPGIRVVLFLVASLPLLPVLGLGVISFLLFFFSWLAVRLVSIPT